MRCQPNFILALLLAPAILAGCGSSRGNRAEILPPPTEVTIGSDALRTGSVDAEGRTGPGGPVAVGVDDSGRAPSRFVVLRGMCSFPLSQIPAGASIVEAKLLIGQVIISGAPYAGLGGAVLVDHVDIGAALDASDFDSTPIESNVGVLSTDPAIETKSMDVVSALQTAVDSGASNLDLRLYFGVSGGASLGIALFNDTSDIYGMGAQRPTLVVSYR